MIGQKAGPPQLCPLSERFLEDKAGNEGPDLEKSSYFSVLETGFCAANDGLVGAVKFNSEKSSIYLSSKPIFAK